MCHWNVECSSDHKNPLQSLTITNTRTIQPPFLKRAWQHHGYRYARGTEHPERCRSTQNLRSHTALAKQCACPRTTPNPIIWDRAYCQKDNKLSRQISVTLVLQTIIWKKKIAQQNSRIQTRSRLSATPKADTTVGRRCTKQPSTIKNQYALNIRLTSIKRKWFVNTCCRRYKKMAWCTTFDRGTAGDGC
jgi:hypothetical protein